MISDQHDGISRRGGRDALASRSFGSSRCESWCWSLSSLERVMKTAKNKKIQYPARIYLAGRWWDLKWIDNRKSKSTPSGSFDGIANLITIEIQNPQYTPQILMHEIIEALFAMRSLRWRGPYSGSQGDYLFVMNHEQLDSLAIDLVAAVASLGDFWSQFAEVKL